LLFLVPVAGTQLDDGLRHRIRDGLRTELSPRHVPDEIHQIAEIPLTLNGKKMEVPVKQILAGVPVEQAARRDAMANPGSLDAFDEFAREVRPTPGSPGAATDPEGAPR
jgi:acetoacetyl-CoA synthetase